jgi:hypothetical protein
MRGRRHPRVVIVIELEELPRIAIDADSFEDQRRLVAWLGRPRTRLSIVAALKDGLDALHADTQGREAA